MSQLEIFFPKSCRLTALPCFIFVHRAFDTLAKALNTTDSSSPPSLADGIDTSGGGSIHVISRDQSTPIIEVEGPLLSDTHVTFKVSVFSLTTCPQPDGRWAVYQRWSSFKNQNLEWAYFHVVAFDQDHIFQNSYSHYESVLVIYCSQCHLALKVVLKQAWPVIVQRGYVVLTSEG